MKCPECGNESKEEFEVLKIEYSESNWDEWDMRRKIKCKKCEYVFEEIW